MNTWNYRIIDFGTHFALCEVHYRNEVPCAYTVEPCGFITNLDEGAEGIIDSLRMAMVAGTKPVLTLADFPSASEVM